jgi:hypothetical protein
VLNVVKYKKKVGKSACKKCRQRNPVRRQRIDSELWKSISGTTTNQGCCFRSNKEMPTNDDVNGVTIAASQEKKEKSVQREALSQLENQ